MNPNPKPGWKSTEAWMALLAMAIGAVVSSGVVTHSLTLRILGLAVTVFASLGYGTQRLLLKVNHLKAKTAVELKKKD